MLKELRVAIPLMAFALFPVAVDAGSPPPLAPSHAATVVTAALAVNPIAVEQLLTSYYSAAEVESGVYVGSEYCIACHKDYAGWRDTKHAKAYRRPMLQYTMKAGLGVVNDFNANGKDDFVDGLDFNTISSAFDPYKPNAPKLSMENGAYYVTIGELKMTVLYTQGGTGDWKQRYVLKVPLGNGGISVDAYTSPIQWNEKAKVYNLYNPQYWYDATTKLPLYGKTVAGSDLAAKNGGAQSKNCIGCHTTGIRQVGKVANGEIQYRPFVASLYKADDPSYFDFDGDGNADVLNIGCEACHGPGSAHILGNGDPAKIVNPKKLTPARANEVCAQCHNRTLSVPNGTYEYPYRDDINKQFIPGGPDALTTYYKDDSGLWPDGVNSVKHHQQWPDFAKSGKPSYQFHQVLCAECHDPHKNTANDHQIIEKSKQETVTVTTKDDNNTLCLACHATHGPFEGLKKEEVAEYTKNLDKIAKVVAAHTNHPYAPERTMGLSRCSGCHMPKIGASAVQTAALPYDMHSHTFEVIAPEKTLKYQDKGGMPNSCAVSCHNLKVNSFGLGLDPGPTKWNEAFDVSNANVLQTYFGPKGKWWDTSKPASATNRSLRIAPPVEVSHPAPVVNPGQASE